MSKEDFFAQLLAFYDSPDSPLNAEQVEIVLRLEAFQKEYGVDGEIPEGLVASLAAPIAQLINEACAASLARFEEAKQEVAAKVKQQAAQRVEEELEQILAGNRPASSEAENENSATAEKEEFEELGTVITKTVGSTLEALSGLLHKRLRH